MPVEIALIALLRENQHLRRQLSTDALTNVGSRRAYETRSVVEGQSYIAIDVNDFKTINDTHGHPVGDEVLAAIAALIRDETDQAYRTGGDEFIVVVDGPIESATIIAARIQRAIAAQHIHGISCSISVGVGPSEVEADQAMYHQKASNQSTIGGRQ